MNRPIGLTIIAWLAIVGGGLQMLGSLGLVGVSAFGALIGSSGAVETMILLGLESSVWIGIVLIALGAVGLVFGYGVLELRPWSWTMGIVLYALNLIAGVVLLYTTGFGMTVLLVTLMSAAIVGYLFTNTARAALGHPTKQGMTPHAPHAA
jgi:hypothetical protein